MAEISFEDAVAKCVDMDPRYTMDAYDFVRDALHIAVKRFCAGDEEKHVSGQQMLEGVKEHALKEYGPMALTILNQWGLRKGLDVGNVVYNLIEVRYFGRSDGDSIQDFDGGYDWDVAFTMPFLPKSKRAA